MVATREHTDVTASKNLTMTSGTATSTILIIEISTFKRDKGKLPRICCNPGQTWEPQRSQVQESDTDLIQWNHICLTSVVILKYSNEDWLWLQCGKKRFECHCLRHQQRTPTGNSHPHLGCYESPLGYSFFYPRPLHCKAQSKVREISLYVCQIKSERKYFQIQ